MLGAVKGIDPNTGEYFDDTKKYIDQLALTHGDLDKLFEGNARRVFPRLDKRLNDLGLYANYGISPATPRAARRS